MKMTFDVLVAKRMEVDIPVHWMPFAEAWFTDEEKRTDAQWDLVDSHSWSEIAKEFLPDGEEVCELEIYSMSENEEVS